MKHRAKILSAALLATVGLAACATAQTLVFNEDFGSLADGTAITTSNTSLTFTRTAGGAPFTGSLTARNSSFGSGSSLRLISSGYGSTPNFTGVGANDLAKSSVYTLSLNIASNLWQTGTSTYIMMGDWTRQVDQVYNPDGIISTNGMTHTTIGAQSLFAIQMTGSTQFEGATLRTISSAGATANIVDQTTSQTLLLANGAKYNLHVVANGSDSAVVVGAQIIASGTMGIYLNDIYIGSAAIAGSVDATAFRIFSGGNSSDNLQNDIEIGDIKLWEGAMAPIPEASTYGMIFAALALATVGTMRYRKGRA